LTRVTSNFRGDDGTLVHPRVGPLFDLYQNSRTRRLSSRLSSPSKQTWLPSSGSSNNGMQSQPLTGRGKVAYSFSCATPLGCTAFSALLSYVLIVYSTPDDLTDPTLSVPLKHPPSSPPSYHTNRLSPIPGSHRLHPPTTRTTSITCNRGESYLCDTSDEPRACWRDHYRLYPACSAGRRTRTSCYACVTESRRFVGFARACSINGTCSLIGPLR
jgi:hypothetical protein